MIGPMGGRNELAEAGGAILVIALLALGIAWGSGNDEEQTPESVTGQPAESSDGASSGTNGSDATAQPTDQLLLQLQECPTLRRDDDWSECSLVGQWILRLSGREDQELDGYYGPLTEGRVEDFQAEVGLPVTGVMDDATKDALAEQVS